ncbi:deoxynucleoside kinase [Microbulbifer thermotolerans]|uniref:Deoxyadenosine kinase n=1 Tax=Microbulbifer thermotolerans TaxID=252514 RepID=A0A143HQS0_MICTH|nr:deoxynucleoside kinase [Microbulbifer thermotolerans]AMX04038.1 deoxyadenosine kinase [Microbulbifer thermotolerans]MCX2779221.1 deoxynucleoside kinase [Microbulbifer thermotolerans]MCX2793549.1 deoxynucleoside kinase [Microbulbifer thermotolerans]MCX2801581.1 deoxynucleoside kinase [Microbulbifer thermotolerans]MCX2803645.1 deoxynucleoside kinase [Microbulbifer thermotolerans]
MVIDSGESHPHEPVITGKTLPRFIAVEGNIGVGKTTLAKKLAATFNYDTLLEQPQDNPFLERFYQDPKSFALPTQLHFLLQRSQQIQALRQDDLFKPVRVSDFLIDKDQLFAEVTLDADELALYEQVYQHLTLQAPKPDLVVYLQAPLDVLQERIRNRGIAAERAISNEYLASLNEAYTNFFHYYDQAPLLIVNSADIDIVDRPEDYRQLVEYMLTITSGRHYYNPGY